MMKSRTAIQVRYAETDAMGIAHHSNYPVWFEVARVAMMDGLGFPYLELEKQGYRLPVIALHLQYFRPCSFADNINVEAFVTERPRVRIRIDYKVFRDDILLASGYSEHAFTNAQGQIVKPHPAFIKALENALIIV